MYFDSHCHLTDAAFEPDRGDAIARALAADVTGMVTICSDAGGIPAVVELTRAHPQVWGTAGIHPHEARHGSPEALERVRDALTSEPRLRAVGECGLDYHYDHSPRETQRAVFRAQLEMAAELGRPVVVHCREAEADVVHLVREHKGSVTGVLHCFSGGNELLEVGVDAGWYVSFAGVITFADTDANANGTADCLEPPPPGPSFLFTDTFDSSTSLASYTETPPSERTSLTVASGLLQLVPAPHQAWYATGNGPALFLPVQPSGDFVIATQINPHLVGDVNARPTADYNVCGLLARSLSDPADWVFAASGRGANASTYTETKTTANGATTIYNFTAPAWQGEIRICRIGSTFRMYRRMNGDTGFVELTPALTRSDLAGTMQLGLAANGFTASPNVQCDYDWVRLASVSSLAGCTAELHP
jgi:TatD DNase family protein